MIMNKLHKLEDELYFSSEGLSNSNLSKFAQSPLHYAEYKKNGIKATRQMELGKQVHAQALEGKTIYKKLDKPIKVSSYEDKDKALEFFSNELTEVQFNLIFEDGEINAEKRNLAYTVGNFVTPDEYEKIQIMTENVTNHPIGKYITKRKESAELVGFAKDPETGLLLKAKIDYSPSNGQVMFDLKTSKSANPKDFNFYYMKKMGYDTQSIHYPHVARLCGRNYEAFYFIVVDNLPPYGVSAIQLKEEHKEESEDKYRRLLDDFKWCQDNNDFTRCYPDEVVYV